jgi:hypothetical protein
LTSPTRKKWNHPEKTKKNAPEKNCFTSSEYNQKASLTTKKHKNHQSPKIYLRAQNSLSTIYYHVTTFTRKRRIFLFALPFPVDPLSPAKPDRVF